MYDETLLQDRILFFPEKHKDDIDSKFHDFSSLKYGETLSDTPILGLLDIFTAVYRNIDNNLEIFTKNRRFAHFRTSLDEFDKSLKKIKCSLVYLDPTYENDEQLISGIFSKMRNVIDNLNYYIHPEDKSQEHSISKIVNIIQEKIQKENNMQIQCEYRLYKSAISSLGVISKGCSEYVHGKHETPFLQLLIIDFWLCISLCTNLFRVLI